LSNKLRTLAYAIVVAASIIGSLYFTIGKRYPSYSSLFNSTKVISSGFGVTDFIQYWSANQVGKNGGNPYDPETMKAMQSGVADSSYTSMMWNPPWILLLLRPVVSLDLMAGVQAWFILNLIGIGAIVLLCEKLYPSVPGQRWLRLSSILLFPPFYNCLRFGQTSIAITVVFLLFAICLKYKRDFWAGSAISVLSVKPHLIYLVGVLLLWWAVKEHRWKLLAGILAGVSLFVCASLLFQGQMFFQWLNCHLHPESIKDIVGVVRTSDWVTPTLGGTIRAIGIGATASMPMERIICVVSLIPIFWWLVRCQPDIRWSHHLPLFLLLSLLLGPYGWFYDNSMLIIIVALLTSSSVRNVERSYLCLLPLYFLTELFLTYFAKSQHQMFFFPVALGLIFWLQSGRSRDRAEIRDW
jgi:hypothetical protein